MRILFLSCDFFGLMVFCICVSGTIDIQGVWVLSSSLRLTIRSKVISKISPASPKAHPIFFRWTNSVWDKKGCAKNKNGKVVAGGYCKGQNISIQIHKITFRTGLKGLALKLPMKTLTTIIWTFSQFFVRLGVFCFFRQGAARYLQYKIRKNEVHSKGGEPIWESDETWNNILKENSKRHHFSISPDTNHSNS